jgi:hypothetical protein
MLILKGIKRFYNFGRRAAYVTFNLFVCQSPQITVHFLVLSSELFLAKLMRLNRAPARYGKAPHKPALVLSLVELIDKGIVSDNQFCADASLVGLFYYQICGYSF